ncbi:linear amide C-N hydrolase [Laceyella putida]|uniref:Linear amide C-N hydrolase n=1 Tax=Laceyella putida TaxID=110101 RepID=A0ABW2RMB6_9BACL
MCTTFFLRNGEQRIVGKNLDIFYDDGCLFTNSRGLKKTALIMPPEQPLTWVSQYGSLTFSQTGKEFPVGGMNEKGLVVEQMTLPETQYPEVDDRPAVKELQWIQYMLDTCCSAQEVLESAKLIRISQSTSHLHYLVCDPSGNAILEHADGKLATYSGDEITVHPSPKQTQASQCLGFHYSTPLENPEHADHAND